MQINAYIGFDPRWPMAFAVTIRSLFEKSSIAFPIHPILLPQLQGLNIYDRPMHVRDGQLFDNISDAPMATEFAISRFFIPHLSGYKGWSLFCDSDFLFRTDVAELFALADDKYAVMCVKHEYEPLEDTKMDGQLQTLYKRKNWSSLMLINNAHPKNKVLEPQLLNKLPGRDLHAFNWLEDDEIGELSPRWNWLEGHSDKALDPHAVHFTRGTPDIKGYENAPFADEWRGVAETINLSKVM